MAFRSKRPKSWRPCATTSTRPDLPRSDQADLVCGYQLQHKSWVTDPNGLWWEAFFTEGVVDEGYGTAEMPDP